MEKSKRYRVYSDYLLEKFGEKIYKIPINLPGTCPNRDGTAGVGGCIFCDEKGAGFECLPNDLSIKEQIEKNKNFYRKKFNAQKFIAYFQAFSNTYLPLESFKRNILSATCDQQIIGISIATRPDCINDDYLFFLQELKDRRSLHIDIELGLQTVNYHTLNKINRGHSLAEFIDAVLRIHKFGLEICTHLIINLPWDNETDVIENAKILSALKIDYVKIHSLYIVKETKLGQLYEEGKLEIISLDDYIKRVILFLQYLDPKIVIQRLIGKGPKGHQYFCNWGTSWWLIKEKIEEQMEQLDASQGEKFNYLNGKSLKSSTSFISSGSEQYYNK